MGEAFLSLTGRLWANLSGNDCSSLWLADLALSKLLSWTRLEDTTRGGFWLDAWLFPCWGGLMATAAEGYAAGTLFETDTYSKCWPWGRKPSEPWRPLGPWNLFTSSDTDKFELFMSSVPKKEAPVLMLSWEFLSQLWIVSCSSSSTDGTLSSCAPFLAPLPSSSLRWCSSEAFPDSWICVPWWLVLVTLWLVLWWWFELMLESVWKDECGGKTKGWERLKFK